MTRWQAGEAADFSGVGRQLKEPTNNNGSAAIPRSIPRSGSLRLLAGLTLAVSLVVAAVVVLQQVQTTAALEVHTHKLLQDVIDETRENARGFLAQAQNAVELTEGLFGTGLLAMARPQELERYFLHQLRVLPQVDALYFGDPSGQFVFAKRDTSRVDDGFVTKFIFTGDKGRQVYRVWRDAAFREIGRASDPVDRYDPRLRPWYERAGAAPGTVWTDPYVFFTSHRPGLTAAEGVRDDAGRLLGVVGADVELQALSVFLAGQGIGAKGSAFILHRNGDVLAFPDPSLLPQPGEGDKFRLATLGDLGGAAAAAGERLQRDLPGFDDMTQAHFATFDAQGERFRLVFAPFLEAERWPWLMGVYAPEEQFATAIRRAQRQSVVLALVIGVVVVTVTFLFGPLLLGPFRSLQRDAFLDPLTELLNRRGFLAAAANEVKRVRSTGGTLAAIMIDMDSFKSINDTHGHMVGDEVLVAVAGRLRCELSGGDLLARYGGEEFAVLCPDTFADEARHIAERLRAAVGTTPVLTSAGALEVSISLGVAESSGIGHGVEELLHLADTGLLRAKRAGRDQVVLADPVAVT